MKKRRQQRSATRAAGRTQKQAATPPAKPPSSAACLPDAGEAVGTAPATEFAKRRGRVILGYDRTP